MLVSLFSLIPSESELTVDDALLTAEFTTHIDDYGVFHGGGGFLRRDDSSDPRDAVEYR